jgi:phage/plasmid-associated DNA primase
MCYDACMALGDGLQPRRIAELTPENLKTLVEDIGGPGWYPAGDLYRWYVGMCREDGLEPVSKKKFGMVLKAMGYQTKTRRVAGQNARCWLITRRAVREVQLDHFQHMGQP